MNQTMSRRFAAWVLALAGCLPMSHALSKGHTHNDHAHEHGFGQVNVIQDGPQVSIDLDSPLHNILGFEHAPKTAQDKAKVKQAKAFLAAPMWIFNPEAKCFIQGSVHIDSDLLKPQKEHDDVSVRWVFQCQTPSALKSVEFVGFQAFPELQTLKVQAVLPTKQFGTQLTPSKPRLDLK